MRSPSPACCRAARSLSLVHCMARRPGAPRWLLLGAMLILGLTGALGAQAAGLTQLPSTAPRPGAPVGPDCTAAPLTQASPRAGLVDEVRVCQALAALPAGTSAVVAGATGLPAGTFRGVAPDLPTAAAEPPPGPRAPLVMANGSDPGSAIAGALTAPAAGAGNPGSPAPAAIAGATEPSPPPSAAPPQTPPLASLAAAAAVSTGPATRAAQAPAGPAPAAPVAAKPAPAPQPHPALGFDGGAEVPSQPFGKLIYQIARTYALNPLLVAAIAKVESDFNPHARSRKGAVGLMQVLPSTARRFGLPRRRDLLNPRKNLEAAGRYLRWLVDRFGDDPVRVLAAYNAGEGAVDRFGGVPPFAETRDYVQRIFGLLGFPLLLDPPPMAAPESSPAAAALAAIAGAR